MFLIIVHGQKLIAEVNPLQLLTVSFPAGVAAVRGSGVFSRPAAWMTEALFYPVTDPMDGLDQVAVIEGYTMIVRDPPGARTATVIAIFFPSSVFGARNGRTTSTKAAPRRAASQAHLLQ